MTRHTATLALDFTLAAIAAIVLLLMSGCTLITPKVITTEIERTAHGFRIVSPKDTTIKGLRLEGANLSVDSYEARANTEALAAGAAESAARAEAVGKLAEAAASLR